jgi:hypothetical protein
MNKLRGVLIALGLLLPNTGCALDMRDAVLSGVFDFVSGTVTETLVNLLPVSAAFSAVQEQADNT